jgi:hypothetical protein
VTSKGLLMGFGDGLSGWKQLTALFLGYIMFHF